MPLKGYIEKEVEIRYANPHARRIGQLSIYIPGSAVSEEFPVPMGCACLQPYDGNGLEILPLTDNNHANCIIDVHDRTGGEELTIPSQIAKGKEFPFKAKDKLVMTVDYDKKRVTFRRKKD